MHLAACVTVLQPDVFVWPTPPAKTVASQPVGWRSRNCTKGTKHGFLFAAWPGVKVEVFTTGSASAHSVSAATGGPGGSLATVASIHREQRHRRPLRALSGHGDLEGRHQCRER